MNVSFPFENLPAGVNVVPRARMSDYTTFRLGGECPVLVDCPTADALTKLVRMLAEKGLPFMIIGQGSNLLVADEGIDWVVLRFCSKKPDIRFRRNQVEVSGNTLLDDLARMTGECGLGDISFCSGIPGTIGGAIAGNAGAFGRQISDVLETVRLLDPRSAVVREIAAGELDFSYRSSRLKQSGEIVLSAVLHLKPVASQDMKKERERILQLRREKHPDWRKIPCAGSVFRNIEPTSKAKRRQAAGWFLEKAGAKELRVGGARLYEKHANIIVAEPGATARDVFLLSEKMASAVKAQFGFDLVREIRLKGKF